VDQPKYHVESHQQAADGDRVHIARLSSYKSSVAAVHHESSEVAQLSFAERADSSTVAVWREVRKLGANDEPEAVIQFAGGV
jgi:hypothetical protein|tara:strand:+ start:210 stop:455 length:246 start_codon:yes stop_codon:yes gene_type:complete